MTSPNLTLTTLSGLYELRRPRSLGDGSALSFDLAGHDIEQAVRSAVSGSGMQAWTLLQELGAFGPSLISAPEMMVSTFMEALKWGRLVLARDGGGQTDDGDPLWAAYDAFIAQVGREFKVGMRAHRLASREYADELRREANYDVVPAPEAAALILRLGQSAGAGPARTAAATLAKSMIDMRSPSGAAGFMLLRAPASQAERIAFREEAITPAKLKKLRDGAYVSFLLVDEKGYPLPGIRLEVSPPGATSMTATSDDTGIVRIDRLAQSGACSFSFHDLVADVDACLDALADQEETPSTEAHDTDLALKGAEGPVDLPKRSTDMTHRLTIRTWHDVLIVTDVPEDEAKKTKASFCLSSAESGYNKTLTTADDAIVDSGWVELLFPDVPRHGLYTLKSDTDGRVEVIFEKIPGKRLTHPMGELEASPPEARFDDKETSDEG